MDLPAAIDRIRRSVFQIQLAINTSPTTLQTMPIGTAFTVSEAGHLITALHVIQAGETALASESGSLKAMFAGPNYVGPTMTVRASFVGQPFAVLDRDADHDLALLQVGGQSLDFFAFQVAPPHGPSSSPTPAHLIVDRPRDGAAVAISGYPLGSPTLITNAGSIASSWAIEPGPQMRDRYLGDFTANPGNSGGPVYNVSGGGVIGVCHGVHLTDIVGGAGRQTAGVTIMIPSEYAAALLERNGVAVPAPNDASSGTRSPRKRKR